MKRWKTESPLLDKAAARQAIIQSLSRREHSRFELFQKLSPKVESLTCLEHLLDDMIERGWQSDQRFAEVFARDRSTRYGPIKIRYELKMRGIDEPLINQTLDALAVDWYEQASSLRQRKFSADSLQDVKIKAKAYRYLAQRGFSSEQVHYALDSANEP